MTMNECNTAKPITSLDEPLLICYERLAPEAIAIRFDREWLTIDHGSLRITRDTFSCISGGRIIVGEIKRLAGIGLEGGEL